MHVRAHGILMCTGNKYLRARMVPQQHLLSRIFPAPGYLRMPAVGVDISDEKIKFIGLAHEKSDLRIHTWGTGMLPSGIVENGIIQKPEVLIQELSGLKKKFATPYIHASLPEDHAYLFQTEISRDVEDAQIGTYLEFQLKENVPLSPDEAIFDFMFVPRKEGEKKARVASVAVYPKEIVYSYLHVFREAGLVPLSLEIEGQANARAVVSEKETATTMVVDIGKYGAELSVITFGIVAYTAMLEVSGDDFTQALAKRLSISYEAAEKLKLEHGFVQSRENQEQFETLLGLVSALRDEINKHLAYWQIHSEKDSNENGVISHILLCGGSANLKGLLQYLTATMTTPVRLANVWENVVSFEKNIPPISRTKSVEYATAIGLGLRSIERGA